MKEIILSADDFGRSHERNMAIDYAFKHGLIKSAALMVNTQFTGEAVDMARRGGYLKHIHCHLNIEAGMQETGDAKPLDKEVLNCDAWCNNGDFNPQVFAIADKQYLKYSKILYRELKAQYLKFIVITNNEANNKHLDFHFYDNLRWSVSLAYGMIIREFHIKTARIFGLHHYSNNNGWKHKIKLFVTRILCYSFYTKVYKSSRINYYLFKPEDFPSIFELYVHPDLLENGDVLDNSIPIFGDRKELLENHINKVKSVFPCEFLSWADPKL